MTTSGNPYSGTPEITVLGQQGQALRQLRYNRSEIGEAVDEQISRHTYNALVHLSASVDARFFDQGDGTLNFQYHSSLSGQVLRSEGVDAGTSHLLLDIEGRSLWQRDARGTMQHYTYDDLGRLSIRSEQINGGAKQVRERLIYGEVSDVSGQYNLRGRLAKHYDTAGLLDHSEKGYALCGGALRQERRLLPVGTDSVWKGEEESDWAEALEPGGYRTNWQYDADGRPLLQIDAMSHQQRYAYDVVGRLKASWVSLNGGWDDVDEERPVLRSLEYSASGQKLREEAGNGVATDYYYEPETQRLVMVETVRDAQSGRDSVLQQLGYEYDAVGNITAIHNRAESTRFFKNQEVTPSRGYCYDALYQLISATGRENATAANGNDAPQSIIPVPVDAANYTNYTRKYRYDRGGNLTRIQHQGNGIAYNRPLLISESSNHGFLKRAGMTSDQVDALFDVGGNQTTLSTGQDMDWNGLNQLQKIIIFLRAGSQNDEEIYRYGGDGMRVRKTAVALSNGATQHQDVIYLPGLELRRTKSGDLLTESLQVVKIGAAGRGQVRVLNWTQGKPDGIVNSQLRYSLDDHLGSSQLELDRNANILTQEEYYPYGGTAVRAAKSGSEVKYKNVRYSGKERDASGLYYYGFRYYQPWLGRWLSADPLAAVAGMNGYAFVNGNPTTQMDYKGLVPTKHGSVSPPAPPTRSALKLNPTSQPIRRSPRNHPPPTPPPPPNPHMGDMLKMRTRNEPIGAAAAPGTGKWYKVGTYRLHWKGARTVSDSTSGIVPHETIRSAKTWTSKHTDVRNAMGDDLVKDSDFTAIGKGGKVASENSHLIAGSLYGPNDVLSAPPASVHQNTEWLAVEQGIKTLGKRFGLGGELRIKATGYVHDSGAEKGQMKAARYKIYIGGSKVFDHVAAGSRGNIGYTTAKAVQTSVEGLTASSVPVSLHGTTPKGTSGTAPDLQAIQSNRDESSTSPMFTDAQIYGITYTGQHAFTQVTQFYI